MSVANTKFDGGIRTINRKDQVITELVSSETERLPALEADERCRP